MKTYEQSGIANQVQLQRKLRTLKYLETEPFSVFLTDFEKTIAELKNCGGKVGDTEMITQLLPAMPESYQLVTTAFIKTQVYYHWIFLGINSQWKKCDRKINMRTLQKIYRLLKQQEEKTGTIADRREIRKSDFRSSVTTAK